MKNLMILILSGLFLQACSSAPAKTSSKEHFDISSVITGPDHSDSFNVKLKKTSYKSAEALRARRMAAAKMRQEASNEDSEGMIRLRKK